MAKAKNTTYQKTKQWLQKHKKLFIRTAWILGIILALWVYPFTRSYIEYPFHFVRCGFQAPIIGTAFAGSPRYRLPSDENYRIGWGTEFFCSEQEAQQAGFSRREPH